MQWGYIVNHSTPGTKRIIILSRQQLLRPKQWCMHALCAGAAPQTMGHASPGTDAAAHTCCKQPLPPGWERECRMHYAATSSSIPRHHGLPGPRPGPHGHERGNHLQKQEVGRRAPHAHVAHVKLRVKHGNVPCARSGLANTTLTIDIGSTSTPAKPPRKSKFIHSALERAPINIWQSHHGGATAPYRMHVWHACLSSMSCIFHTPVPHPADSMALAWCHQSRPTRHRRESKPV